MNVLIRSGIEWNDVGFADGETGANPGDGYRVEAGRDPLQFIQRKLSRLRKLLRNTSAVGLSQANPHRQPLPNPTIQSHRQGIISKILTNLLYI